jgi:hypothetical protein
MRVVSREAAWRGSVGAARVSVRTVPQLLPLMREVRLDRGREGICRLAARVIAFGRWVLTERKLCVQLRGHLPGSGDTNPHLAERYRPLAWTELVIENKRPAAGANMHLKVPCLGVSLPTITLWQSADQSVGQYQRLATGQILGRFHVGHRVLLCPSELLVY